MEEIILKGKILESFDIKHVLECGQVFRFGKINEKYYVLSKGECAFVQNIGDYCQITCTKSNYFKKYFDFSTDYDIIKQTLSKEEILRDSISNGNGIRILNQDLFEVIISFILSSNNNIPRIKGMIERLCFALGEKKEFLDFEYYTFPRIEDMATKDEQFYRNLGFGFRAKYIKKTIELMQNGFNIEVLNNLSTEEAREKLLQLSGVGRKVADCILLFGLHKMDVFPVDTWIEKIYRDHFYQGELTREQQSDYFVSKFKELSGYAQQYLFYYKREIS